MARTKKPSTYETTVEDAISQFYSVAQDLRDETQEVADNLEEKFSSTNRYEMMREAADTLDGFCDQEPDPGVDSDVLRASVTVYAAKRTSRRARLDEACGGARSALDAIQERIDHLDSVETKKDKTNEELLEMEEEQDALQTILDEVSNHLDEAENIEFPGMFG